MIASRAMSKAESTVIGLTAGAVCPLLTFVLFWWTAAGLGRILPIAEGSIIAAALAGLALGIGLDVLCLRRWVSSFYGASMTLLIVVYVACSIVAVAFFMGLPLGNLALGTLAGAYVGRREYHAGATSESSSKSARKASIFTALVTGAEALPIGILALRERSVVDLLQQVLRADETIVAGPMGIGLILVLCVVLMGIQFACTRVATRWAFGQGRGCAV